MAETVRASVTNAVEGKGRTIVEKWTGQIAAYDREFSTWEARVGRIIKRYRDESRDHADDARETRPAKFNVLWSNVQTLVPAVYSKVPKPDVSRRFRDNDPVGRVAALILERALEFETQHYPDFRMSMKSAVFDRFLGGRGVVWARYEPHIRAVEQGQPTDGEEVTEDVDAPQEELDYECAPVDYVHWKDFGHTVARSWDEVTAVWRRVYMTREACVARFGKDVGSKIPLDSVPDELKTSGAQSGDSAELSRACVYEIWDKLTLKAHWISKSMPKELDSKDDPLELEGFFPCPKPLYATMTNESLVPVPDFSLYQDQARALDTLAERIQGLIEMLKVVGAHDASVPELKRIFTEGANGDLLPVANWANFAEKKGLAGSIDIVDLTPVYEALRAAYEAMGQELNQIYDLTGLSDIVRGQSEAAETATAQRIKGQYASLRLKAMQGDVAVFATQILQLKAQIMCGNFAPQTLLKMAAVEEFNKDDLQYVPAAIALLIGPERSADPVQGGRGDNPMLSFRIEVNSDTMVQLDEEEEKTRRMEFITAMGGFMEKAMPLAQAAPQMTPLIMLLWKFSVSAFKVGKTIEGAFDQAIDRLSEQAKQPQPEKADPEMAKVQAQAEADKAELAAKTQADQQRLQMESAAEEKRLQQEAQAESQRLQQEQWATEQRMFMERQAAVQQARDDMLLEKFKAMLNERTELRKAEIQAEASVEVAKHAPKPEAASG